MGSSSKGAGLSEPAHRRRGSADHVGHGRSHGDRGDILNELEVHQIELAVQNTELIETQLELRAALERYRDLYDFAPVGYVTLDDDSVVRKANLTAGIKLGLPRARLEGASFARWVVSEDAPRFWSHLLHVLSSSKMLQCELRLVTTHGEPVWMQLHSVKDEKTWDSPVSVRIAMLDVTAHKAVAVALQRTQAELERKIEERTHDLRAANEALHAELAARQRVERELRASESRLRALASAAALVEQRERKRLAADLHDGLGQMLTLARIKIEAYERAGAEQGALRDVSAILADAQARAESLMFQLSPPLLRDVGIRAACEWLAEEITKLYGLTVEIDADREHRWVDEVVPVTLYRGVRELLLNAAVHANAARATVRLRTEPPHLRITVTDDGDGFAPGAKKGFGLCILEERLNHLGGGLDIATAPAAGTAVTITLPVVPSETSTEEALS